MIDVNYNELNELIENKESFILCGYTSMCGTCKVALNQLNVIEQTQTINGRFLKINIGFNKKLIDDYQITSVPVFILYKEGQLIDQFYAFHSIEFLYNMLKKLN